MLYLVFGVIGWLIGALAYRKFGSFFGLALGVMMAEIFMLRRRLTKLEKGVRTSPAQEKTPATPDIWKEGDQPAQPPPQAGSDPAKVEPSVHSEDDLSDLEPDLLNAQAPSPPSVIASSDMSADSPPESHEDFTELPSRLVSYLKTFFTTGNVVTKIGVVVLFFGFAFLLKYAAQRNLVPIEFRLIGVFLGGLGLLGAGWRFRGRKLMYGLLLQGCGIGVLYLTIFAAARFYHLLPYGLSFGVMVCLVALSGILAVVQDAKYLALFGIAGGFLAPVLMSTGSGSHVALFSYYALLNAGIAGIAWYKAWRELNLAGFIFTFVIASLWGHRYYQPRYFASTEPFLILFFLCYVFIAVLFASRQPVHLKGYVDGTLVFGVPLAAFGLQYGLVHNIHYGMAISALSLGLFYIILATLLWRRKSNAYRLLSEAFLAFGIVFGSLAIPLALDGRWTSAAWALEGAAILWIGVRQGRLLPRLFGMLLQAGSGISFLIAMDNPYRPVAVANSFFIGCVLISLAGLFTGWHLTRQSQGLRKWEHALSTPFMGWGLAWWFGAAWLEIERFVDRPDRCAATLIHAALSFGLIDIVSRRLAWKQFSYATLLLLPAMGLALLSHLAGVGPIHLFAGIGWLAWLLAFGTQYRILFNAEKTWPEKALPLWHQCSLWLLLWVLTLEMAHYTGILLPGVRTWIYCVWAAVPATAVLFVFSKGHHLAWPIHRFHGAYVGVGMALPVIYLFGWTLWANFYRADPAPLPYWPVLNPVVMTQIYLLLIIFKWMDHRTAWFRQINASVSAPRLQTIVFAGGFILLNAIVARCLHFWGHVPYTLSGLFDSVLFQAAISILWGVTALGATLLATQRGSRPAWIAGASILCLVVIKLFFVDLAGTGTVARIVSFLGVGSLMLLIGYFSPLPPACMMEDA